MCGDMTKACERCGKEIDKAAPGYLTRTKYCSKCRKIITQLKHNARRKESRKRKRLQRPPKLCQRCGKPLVDQNKRRTKWCDDCVKIVEREQNRQYRARNADKMQERNRLYHKRYLEKQKAFLGESNLEANVQSVEHVPAPPPTFYFPIEIPRRRHCKICNTTFAGTDKVCPECQQRERERKLQAERERIEQERLARRKIDPITGEPVKDLSDWAREAAECNLDYGTYRALIDAGKTFEEVKAIYGGRQPTTHSHIQKRKTI